MLGKDGTHGFVKVGVERREVATGLSKALAQQPVRHPGRERVAVIDVVLHFDRGEEESQRGTEGADLDIVSPAHGPPERRRQHTWSGSFSSSTAPASTAIR
jgi:hypothetical protein